MFTLSLKSESTIKYGVLGILIARNMYNRHVFTMIKVDLPSQNRLNHKYFTPVESHVAF